MHSWKMQLLYAVSAVSVVVMLVATVGILRAPKPNISAASHTESFTVIEKHPTGVHAHHANPLFDLTITVSPTRILEDSDATITVAISKVEFPLPGHVSMRVESESFKIIPSESRSLDLELGTSAQFVATPKARGDRKVRVYAQYIEPVRAISEKSQLEEKPWDIPTTQPEYERIVGIEVLERPTFIGLSTETLSTAQVISVIFGLPSVLLLFTTRILKKKKKESADEPGR
jgi:hypothetical protein